MINKGFIIQILPWTYIVFQLLYFAQHLYILLLFRLDMSVFQPRILYFLCILEDLCRPMRADKPTGNQIQFWILG